MLSTLRTIKSIKEQIAHAISPLLGSVAASIADKAFGVATYFDIDVMNKPHHAKAFESLKEEITKARKNDDDGENDSGANDDSAYGKVFAEDIERYGEPVPPRKKIKNYGPGGVDSYPPLMAQTVLNYRQELLKKLEKQLSQTSLYIKILKLREAVKEVEVMAAKEEEERQLRRERYLKKLEQQRRLEEEQKKRELEEKRQHEKAMLKLKEETARKNREEERERLRLSDPDNTYAGVLSALEYWEYKEPYDKNGNTTTEDGYEDSPSKDDGLDFC